MSVVLWRTDGTSWQPTTWSPCSVWNFQHRVSVFNVPLLLCSRFRQPDAKGSVGTSAFMSYINCEVFTDLFLYSVWCECWVVVYCVYWRCSKNFQSVNVWRSLHPPNFFLTIHLWEPATAGADRHDTLLPSCHSSTFVLLYSCYKYASELFVWHYMPEVWLQS